MRGMYWDDIHGCIISEHGNVFREEDIMMNVKNDGHKKTQDWALYLKEATLMQSLKSPGLQNC